MSQKTNYYVYQHVCPTTKAIVYIGKGVNGRAWDVTRARGGNQEHQKWMLDLCDQGYLPTDWVHILGRGLSEKEAFALELDTLHKNGTTPFNRQCGERQHQSKLTNTQAKEVFHLAWGGKLLIREIADQYGICRAAVSMIKNKLQWKTVLKGETNENYERSLQRTKEVLG